MAERLKHIKPTPQDFSGYLRRNTGMPPLDTTRLDLSLHEGDRSKLSTPTTGDGSLVLAYKSHEGAVVSFGLTEEDELKILQLQGARGKGGFRVNTGLQVIRLFADQIGQITTDPDNGLSRVTMPPIIAIQGMVDATEGAIANYEELASRLGMGFSDEEKQYVRDIK